MNSVDGKSFDDILIYYGDHKKEFGTWDDIRDALNNIFDTNLTESCYRKRYKRLKKNTVESIQEKEWLAMIEKKKAQTLRVEMNRWLTEESRYRLILETVQQSIMNLEPLQVPEFKNTEKSRKDKAGILCFSDCHYGAEFEIRGLNGEIINQYSPEICERRMWDILEQTLEVIKKEGLTELHIFSLGDDIDGILRVGQLFKLRYGVIESTIKYAQFLATWLNELSKYVRIKFYITHGNHSQLRMINQPKNTFKEENMGIIIVEFVKNFLKENKNFELITNPTGHIYTKIFEFNIMGIHGEVKNIEQAKKDFTDFYKQPIDILIGGHKHSEASKNVAVNRDVIRVPSVMGVNDFAEQIIKSSNAGAKLLILEPDNGKKIDYFLKVN